MLDSIPIVPAEQVPALLPMDRCMRAVEAAFREVARGRALQPLRTVLRLPDGESSFLVMPGATAEPAVLGAKLLTLFPGNHDKKIDSHQGVIVLFDPADGRPAAVIDAGPVTAVRTGAASGLATRLLAREDAGDLAIIGSGVQARSHLEAMLHVRRLRRVRVWSPTPLHREAFAQEASERHGIEVEATRTAREAVEGADLVCTVTGSPTPVVAWEWIAPGAHLNVVGASTARTRELDSETVRHSRFYVDLRESALAEAGDLLVPISEGVVDASHIAGELGEVLEGSAPGRTSDDEVTVFKSLGMAVQDLAAGRAILGALQR